MFVYKNKDVMNYKYFLLVCSLSFALFYLKGDTIRFLLFEPPCIFTFFPFYMIVIITSKDCKVLF